MHDLVLSGGTVSDGLGAPGAVAEVAVAGGRVVAVGRDVGPARRVVDVDGLYVAPGSSTPTLTPTDIAPGWSKSERS